MAERLAATLGSYIFFFTVSTFDFFVADESLIAPVFPAGATCE
jgi:hypothetical protein